MLAAVYFQDWGAEEDELRSPSAALEALAADQNCLWEWCHRIADKDAAAQLVMAHIGALCLARGARSHIPEVSLQAWRLGM